MAGTATGGTTWVLERKDLQIYLTQAGPSPGLWIVTTELTVMIGQEASPPSS